MRILSINTNRIWCRNYEKIMQLVNFCVTKRVDAVLVIEDNMKWKMKLKDIIKYKLNRLGKSYELIGVDSKGHTTTCYRAE